MTLAAAPAVSTGEPAGVGATLRRFAGWGCLAAASVAAGGVALERARLGRTKANLLARIEREVRATFDADAAELRDIARTLAISPAQMSAALDDPAAARALFDAAEQALQLQRRPATNLAITAYAASGAPIAWSGRPSELPRERIAGPAALFVAPGPLGPRLVYLAPLPGDTGQPRIGAIAAERVLAPAPSVRTSADDSFVLQTSLAPVSLRARYEGAGEAADRRAFVISSPSGETLLEGHVADGEVERIRHEWRQNVLGVVLVVLGVTILLLAGPLLELRARSRTSREYLGTVAGLVTTIVAGRVLLWMAARVPPNPPPLLSSETYGSALFGPALRSPIDFLLTGLAALALVALGADAVERWRRRRPRAGGDTRRPSPFRLALPHAGAGLASVLLILGYQRFLADTLANSTVDVLHFSIHPWHPARLAIDFGLILFHAVVIWISVVTIRLAGTVRGRWHASRRARQGMLVVLQALPASVLILVGSVRGIALPVWPTAIAVAACLALATLADRGVLRYRHASQAARLIALLLALIVPAFVMYPTVLHFAAHAKGRLIETQFAREAIMQREELQLRLRRSLAAIDQLAELPDLVATVASSASNTVSTDTAFAVWSRTDLAQYRLTSAVELYGGDGALVSRFALNLPEYTSAPQKWREAGCQWELFEEVAPFGSEDRRVLHAGRGLCRPPSPSGVTSPSRRMAGAIVVHVMLDYNTLPYISSQSPYFELFRTNRPQPREGVPGRDVEFVVYGWGRMPIYTSAGTAWSLDPDVFSKIYASRDPFWTTVRRRGQPYAVYFSNDRAGIYALGYPLITPFGHLVNLAELATLAGVGYVLLLAAMAVFSAVIHRRATSGRALLNEIRASFYRKLFLAFVLASVIPVVILAFATRAYIAAQLRDGVESAAVRTAAVARRVVEEYVTLQQRGAGGLPVLDDDLMVWISRVIDQDVNIFNGAHLVATSERDLFASGLLPTRTPGRVYRAIALEHLPSFVGEEEVGEGRYLLAAAPVRTANRNAILTVPLTLRQQEIERDIDELDRRVLLAALVFILLGAGIGYWMAERIADPVNRLTRATRRIARGDLDARIAATSSDELRRLVEAFNGMADELQRQRPQLERTHRLEAWAEMARQVAHEIKNPLTPIQLSAEHLRRVHADHGAPLSPVLDDCITTILSQVHLLRQISAEFSSFASSPTARFAPAVLAEVVAAAVEPYRVGLGARIAIDLAASPSLPVLSLDRTLLSRALTNVIENAIHAMPGSGVLTITTGEDHARGRVYVSVGDTGAGMDDESLRRVFEPYFSTKASGTGLGLAIARRNVELNGGTISVTSQRGRGTTVTIDLPMPAPASESGV